HSLPRYIDACGPRVNGNLPGSPRSCAALKWRAARSLSSKKGLSLIADIIVGSWQLAVGSCSWRLQLAWQLAVGRWPLAEARLHGQRPTVNSQLPTVNGQLPTANCQPPTANCQLPTVNCQLPTANHIIHALA